MKRQHDECRQFLESYRELRTEVTRLWMRHERLWNQATRVTPRMSLTPGGGGSDRDNLLTMLADADGEALTKYAEADLRQHMIEDFIDDIPTAMSRIILRLRYVELLDWRDIPKALEKSRIYYSEQHIYRLHGIALREARELWNKRKGTSHE